MEKYLKCFLIISIPFFLLGVISLLPTFDDWSYITTPYFGDFFSSDRLLPTGTYWRPFDAIIGYIVGINTNFFPSFNHIIIFIGHLACTYLIYLLSKRNNIAALFFYLSTAMLGTVLDIDSANQVYAQFWGLFSLFFYTHNKKTLWVVCVLLATLAKENGIVFSVIPILLKYSKQPTWAINDELRRDCFTAITLVGIYVVARILLTPDSASINSEYLTNGLLEHVKDIIQLLAYVFIPLDYVAVVYQPSQDIVLAGATLFLALPFLYVLVREFWAKRSKKMLWALVLAFFISASPHIVTLLSVMHCYSALGMAALIVAYLVPKPTGRHNLFFSMFMFAALISAIHHGLEAYKSGMVGKEMAQSVLLQLKGKPQNVLAIEVDNNEQKYSMFCVIPRDAFGRGISARHESGYTIAKELSDTLIGPFATTAHKQAEINKIRDQYERNYDSIWLIDGKTVKVLK